MYLPDGVCATLVGVTNRNCSETFLLADVASADAVNDGMLVNGDHPACKIKPQRPGMVAEVCGFLPEMVGSCGRGGDTEAARPIFALSRVTPAKRDMGK